MTLDDTFASVCIAMDAHKGNYFWEPIPIALDDELLELVTEFIAADETARDRLLNELTNRHRQLLASFAVRLASIAVRSGDPERVLTGLIALWLGLPEDDREAVMDVAPLYHAALKLGADPTELFERASTVASDETFHQFLRSFLSRSEHDKSLRALGYHEAEGPDGFRFEPGGSG